MATLDTRNPADAFIRTYSTLKGEYRAQDANKRQEETHKQNVRLRDAREARDVETHKGQKEERTQRMKFAESREGRAARQAEMNEESHNNQMKKFGWEEKREEYRQQSGYYENVDDLAIRSAKAGLTEQQQQNVLNGYKIKAHKQAEFVAERESYIRKIDSLMNSGGQGVMEAVREAQEKGLLDFDQASMQNADKMLQTGKGLLTGEVDPNSPDGLKLIESVFDDTMASWGIKGKYDIVNVGPDPNDRSSGKKIFMVRDKETGEVGPFTKFRTKENWDPVKTFDMRQLTTALQNKVHMTKWMQEVKSQARAQGGLVEDVTGSLATPDQALKRQEQFLKNKNTQADIDKTKEDTKKIQAETRKAEAALNKTDGKVSNQFEALRKVNKDDEIFQYAVDTIESEGGDARDISEIMGIANQRAEESDETVGVRHIQDAVAKVQTERQADLADDLLTTAYARSNEDVDQNKIREWVGETRNMDAQAKKEHMRKRLEEERTKEQRRQTREKDNERIADDYGEQYTPGR